MVTIERIFSEGGIDYIKVRVESCCTKTYLFEVTDKGFFNVEKCEMATKGMTNSIKIALKDYEQQNDSGGEGGRDC